MSRVAPGWPTPSLTHRGRSMQEASRVFVGLDTSKLKISVPLAEEGRQGEVVNTFSCCSAMRRGRLATACIARLLLSGTIVPSSHLP